MRKEISKSKRRMSTVEEQPLVNFQLPQAESPSLIVPQNRRNRTQLADVPEESDHDDSDHDDPEHGDEVEMPCFPKTSSPSLPFHDLDRPLWLLFSWC